jgi:hypothetical protein
MFFTPTAYYNSLTIDYTSNIVAWYNFNGNASGSTTPPYHGTPTNMSFTNPGITGGPADFSATFNGSTSYITIADADDFSFGTGAFSINFWIKKTTLSFGYIFTKRTGSGGSNPIEYQMDISATNFITLYIFPNNNRTIYFTAGNTNAVPTDTWTMVTFTYSGFTGPTSYNNLKCYINGSDDTIVGNVGTSNTGMANTNAPVTFGRLGDVGSGYFNGQLDQFRVWKGKALNSAEVSKIYTDKF